GGVQLVQYLPQPAKTPQTLPQTRQLQKRGVRAAAPIEQPIHLVHDGPQRPQRLVRPCQAAQQQAFGSAQMTTDEQVAMLEQVRDPLLDVFGLPLQLPGFLALTGPATR